MHLMAITNWAQLTYKQSTYEPDQLLVYYKVHICCVCLRADRHNDRVLSG